MPCSGVVASIGREGTASPVIFNSSEAPGLRARASVLIRFTTPTRIAIFGRLRTDAASPQTITRKYFATVHRVLDERTPVIAAAHLPFASAVSRDGSIRLVAPA